MAWMTFEILINVFQGFLALRYVKACFPCGTKTRAADALLMLSFSLYLTGYLCIPSSMPPDGLIFMFPMVYALRYAREPKVSVVFWMLVFTILFNLGSVVTYPIFELLPVLLGFEYPSFLFKRFVCIMATNAALFLVFELVIYVKRTTMIPRVSSYVIFIAMLTAFYVLEEFIYMLFRESGYLKATQSEAASAFSWEMSLAFLVIYIALHVCVTLFLLLFHTVARDSEREHRYQAEIAMLNLSRQHQQELAQMHEELTQRQHDYKHHLQTLQELVDAGDDQATARAYLNTLMKARDGEEAILTGNPSVDALLSAKRRGMEKHGIRFAYRPYPLSSLPISTLDFCSIVGNLLDNAVEGVLRMPGVQMDEAEIRLSFSRSWDMFYIYCENPCEPSAVVVRKGRFVSSKQDGRPGLHGVGLHSVENIAARADGRAEFTVSGRTFYAKVVLPFLSGMGETE